ncbi:MAG: hypothetical protein ACPGUY_07470 [Akkermansiaceae bacterium]
MKRLILPLLFLGTVISASLHAQEAAPDAKLKPCWQPKLGQKWQYQVTVEVQEGTELPANVEGQKIEKLDGKVRATYRQTNVYRGLQAMNPKDEESKKAHAFHLSNGDQLEEIQYMSITAKGVAAVGTKPEGTEPKELMALSKPIPLMWADWKGGEAFPVMLDHMVGGQKIRLVRKFKVIGWEELTTKAGKFRALHVQVSGKNGAMEIKRNYWFSPDDGFIKEVKKYYVGEKMVLTQYRVLEKITTPEGE